MKKILFFSLILLSPILFAVIFLLVMTLTDVEPKPSIPLTTENNKGTSVQTGTPISITTFNIGYAGLDKKQDSFMDGGTMSGSSSKEQTWINLKAIGNFLSEENTDIIFLQEVNINAHRSFHINEREYFATLLKDYSSTFGMNHKVKWVPFPITNPIKDVHSGVVTLTKFYTEASTRYQLPGKEIWPVRIFDLDRCFIENRIRVNNGRELVLINLHLSAYDKGGATRKLQLNFLKNYIIEEYNRGNYLIVGGDWNHVLPGTIQSIFEIREKTPFWVQYIPEDFTPDNFIWGNDINTPTVRNNATSYQKGMNFVTVIDGFLVSPNVEISEINTHDLGFNHSDHNPVIATFILMEVAGGESR